MTEPSIEELRAAVDAARAESWRCAEAQRVLLYERSSTQAEREAANRASVQAAEQERAAVARLRAAPREQVERARVLVGSRFFLHNLDGTVVGDVDDMSYHVSPQSVEPLLARLDRLARLEELLGLTPEDPIDGSTTAEDLLQRILRQVRVTTMVFPG